MEYIPYKVEEGKEYLVKEKEGSDKFAGSYLEEKAKSTDGIAIGLYKDPIRGPEKLVDYPVSVMKRHMYIGGHGEKSTLERNIAEQLSRKGGFTYIYRGNWERDHAKDIDLDRGIPFDILEFNYDLESDRGKQEMRVFLQQIGILVDRYVEYSDVISEMEEALDIVREQLIENPDMGLDELRSTLEDIDENEYSELFDPQIKNDFDAILKALQDVNIREGEDISIRDIVRGEKSISIEPDRDKDVSVRNVKLLLLEVWKHNLTDLNSDHFILVNDFDQFIESEYDVKLFEDIIPKARSYNMGVIIDSYDIDFEFKRVRNVIRDIFGIHILLTQYDRESAGRMGQIYDTGGDRLLELDRDEAILRIISEEYVSDVNVKATLFPKFRDWDRIFD